MKTLSPQLLSLVGFSASQWAEERCNGSRHKRQYRRLVAAGIELHENADRYAAAPKMEAALKRVIDHAVRAVAKDQFATNGRRR